MDKKNFILLALFTIGLVAIILFSGKTYRVDSRYRGSVETNKSPFEGKGCPDLECLANRFLNCKIASYSSEKAIIYIYGLENDKCHIKTAKNTLRNCYFSKNNLTIPLLNQLLGNNEGLDGIIQQECN